MSHAHPTHTSQPGAGPQMSAEPKKDGRDDNAVHSTSEAFLQGAAKEAGEQAVKYEAENAEQHVDEAKEKAKGLWAKYCGCLGSA